MATNEEKRTQMISEFMSDKENLLAGVSSVLTPGRKPLKPVQENIVGTPEVLTTLKKRIARSSLTPNGLNQRKKRKSTRLSIPVHVFRKTLKQNTKIKSPLTYPSMIPKLDEGINVNVSRKTLKQNRRIRYPLTYPSMISKLDEGVNEIIENSSASEISVIKEKDTDEIKDEEKELDSFAERVVNQVFKDIAKSSKVNQETNSYVKKIQEFTQIILQMNKERLELEKQLSLYKREPAVQPVANKEKNQNGKKKGCNEGKNHLDLEKKLSQKMTEIQNLKRELKVVQAGKKSKVHSEKEIEAKKEEVKHLKIELNQLKHQIREVPGLKNELQKSRQQVSQLNEIAFACRRENNSQKTLITKIQKEEALKEAKAKQLFEKSNKHIKVLEKNLLEREKMIMELKKEVEKCSQENSTYKLHCETLCSVVDRLEAVSRKAQTFKSAVEVKVKDLSSSLKIKENMCTSLEDQLQSSRNETSAYKQECEELKARVKDLQNEVDIGHLEISRQRGVIAAADEQLEKMRVENCLYQEHLELVQSQQQEMNDFLAEEKRTMEETAKEMEKELEETRNKGMKLDETFRETSVRCGELEQEVKLSRSLYLEKQEELDATQSQAHCIMFQLQNEITDAQESLSDVWDVLDALLNRFREQARLDCLQTKKKKTTEEEPSESNAQTTPRSLVQSILTAVAKGTKANESDDSCNEDQPSFTLCTQINELKQGLLELSQIGYGQAAATQAMEKIAELEQNREAMEVTYKRLVKNLQSELDTCRINQSNMQIENQRQKSEIDHLTSSLINMREHLQQTMKKNDSMCHLLDVEAAQRQKIKMLIEDLDRKEVEHKRLESDKDCIEEQLKETIARVNELCSDNPDTTKNCLPGNVLEEKFAMERKLKQIKEKHLEYRLKTDDSLNEYKITSNQKIQALERNLHRAENEICRLDEILEKIRIVLHKNETVINQCPSLTKVLRFLDGDESADQ